MDKPTSKDHQKITSFYTKLPKSSSSSSSPSSSSSSSSSSSPSTDTSSSVLLSWVEFHTQNGSRLCSGCCLNVTHDGEGVLSCSGVTVQWRTLNKTLYYFQPSSSIPSSPSTPVDSFPSLPSSSSQSTISGLKKVPTNSTIIKKRNNLVSTQLPNSRFMIAFREKGLLLFQNSPTIHVLPSIVL